MKYLLMAVWPLIAAGLIMLIGSGFESIHDRREHVRCMARIEAIAGFEQSDPKLWLSLREVSATRCNQSF